MEKDNNDYAYATLDQLMAVDQRVTLLEQKLSRIEGILEQMDKRIDDMNQRLTEFREDFNRRLESLEARIDSNFKWVLGFWLSTIALIISTMIPVALKILGVI